MRRVLSVERNQMDRRMEKWAWDERVCVCGVVEAGFGRLQWLLLSVTIDYKYRDITSKEN